MVVASEGRLVARSGERLLLDAKKAYMVLNREDFDFIPTDDLVVLEAVASGDMTEGGIVVPIGVQKQFEHYRVVAVGPGRITAAGQLIPVRVAVGDLVLASPKRGFAHPLPVKAPEMMIVQESAIIAVLKPKAAE
jgi:chaperonin GroES